MLRLQPALLLLASCNVPAPVHVPPDAGDTPCERAYWNLESLGCQSALGSAGPDGQRGTEDDLTFVDLCERFEASADTRGLLGVPCLQTAGSCAESEECGGEL